MAALRSRSCPASPVLQRTNAPCSSAPAPRRLPTICAQRIRRRAKKPGDFEVVKTPPPKHLGIHSLPPDTHNGDNISVNGEDYVVSSLVVQYRLVKGRYERDHNKLEVQQVSRWILGRYLDNLYLEA